MRCNNKLSLIDFCKQITGYWIAWVDYWFQYLLTFFIFNNEWIDCKDSSGSRLFPCRLLHFERSQKSWQKIHSICNRIASWYEWVCSLLSNLTFYNFSQYSKFVSKSKTMLEWLKNEGIKCTLIIDAAIAYIMERVDIVLVGAEGVAESGGIINKVLNETWN